MQRESIDQVTPIVYNMGFIDHLTEEEVAKKICPHDEIVGCLLKRERSGHTTRGNY